jgi:hypothetical protein
VLTVFHAGYNRANPKAIRAVRVKLQDGGAVEGDIFHRSLSIDENSQFEGSSRRVEKPIDLSSSDDAKGTLKKGQGRRGSVTGPSSPRRRMGRSTRKCIST